MLKKRESKFMYSIGGDCLVLGNIVVMLPTNEKAQNCLVLGNISKFMYSIGGGYLTQSYLKDFNKTAYHLYILSDEKIEKGDWCYHLGMHRIEKWNGDNRNLDIDLRRKIIATTDSSLKLPRPSLGFINEFIAHYNAKTPITHVMVGYEEISDSCDTVSCRRCNCREIDNILKVNPKDNTITIHKVKDSWNREEVVELLHKCNKDLRLLAGFRLPNWIDQNL